MSFSKCVMGQCAGLGGAVSLTRQGGILGTSSRGGHGGVTEQPAKYRGTESLVGPGRFRLGQPQVVRGTPFFHCAHTPP